MKLLFIVAYSSVCHIEPLSSVTNKKNYSDSDEFSGQTGTIDAGGSDSDSDAGVFRSDKND